MRRKQKVTINLDPEVVRKARELGLNISKIAENALKEYIERLESSDYKNNVSSDSFWWQNFEGGGRGGI